MAHLTMLSSRISKLNSPYDRNQIFTSNVGTHSTLLRSYQYPKRVQTNTLRVRAMSSTPTTVNSDSFPYKTEQLGHEGESSKGKRFDWYAQWYPVIPVCDLDKRVPCGKRVMGLDVVVWWDKNELQWKVFDDMCPHRLAPLSEGRIDQLGRLQCVYHGWCFNGSGDCKLIPQAPPSGPPVNTLKNACATVYPSTVQNGIVWFWPNFDPKFKDILHSKKPPYLHELDDPSYISYTRDINYGYETLIENLMDPSHLPYAHYGLVKTSPPKNRVDREGGGPHNMNVLQMDINGYTGKYDSGTSTFLAPCIYTQEMILDKGIDSVLLGENEKVSSVSQQYRVVLIFMCVPVSPGKSRLIILVPRKFGVWRDLAVPRWVFHLDQNIIIDSDLYLLHCQDQKLKDLGPSNWQSLCFVPTKADGFVVGFRRWLNKYSEGEVDWRAKFSGGALPPTPPREELLDRYWTHTANCTSCAAAYKGLNLAQTALQVTAFCLIGAVGLTKSAVLTTVQRSMVFSVAVLSFAASKWLSCFIYKSFHFHDYNHALK